MQTEDALHAGVAVMSIVRASFISLMQGNGISAEALRFVQVAMSKVRQRIAKHETWDDDASIISVTFLAHLSVSLLAQSSHCPPDCGQYHALIHGKVDLERSGSFRNSPNSTEVDGSLERRTQSTVDRSNALYHGGTVCIWRRTGSLEYLLTKGIDSIHGGDNC